MQSKGSITNLCGYILLMAGGVAAVLSPTLASLGIAVLVGAALLLSGALRFGYYLGGSPSSSGWDVLQGILDMIAALAINLNFLPSAQALSVLLGACVTVKGLITVFLCVRRRSRAQPWRAATAWGILSLLLGLLMVAYPFAVVLGVGILLGIHMIMVGILGIAHFIQDRKVTGGTYIDGHEDTH